MNSLPGGLSKSGHSYVCYQSHPYVCHLSYRNALIHSQIADNRDLFLDVQRFSGESRCVSDRSEVGFLVVNQVAHLERKVIAFFELLILKEDFRIPRAAKRTSYVGISVLQAASRFLQFASVYQCF